MGIEDMWDKTGILIDGNNFLYRTYHVLKHKAKGDITEGFIAYSFINQIRCLIPNMGTLNPMVYILWDGKDSREPRIKIYKDYKGNRAPVPSLIHHTKNSLQEELGAICNRLAIKIDGVEADDLMHLMVKEPSLQSHAKKWMICTRDEDLMQSLDEHSKYYNPYTKVIWTEDSMREKYGFGPRRLILFKAMVGDTSDNWPGVPGVGKVTANKLLQNDLPLEEVIENIQKKLGTSEKKDIFFQGLQLCELPLRTIDKVKWVQYLRTLVGAPIKQNWTHLHQIFKINAVDKAQFQIG